MIKSYMCPCCKSHPVFSGPTVIVFGCGSSVNQHGFMGWCEIDKDKLDSRIEELFDEQGEGL